MALGLLDLQTRILGCGRGATLGYAVIGPRSYVFVRGLGVDKSISLLWVRMSRFKMSLPYLVRRIRYAYEYMYLLGIDE